MDGISIIICCYNGASRITDALKHLSKQKVNGIAWEILPVDNASTDNTEKVATKFWSTVGVKPMLRIIHESKPGLSFARERGIQEAKFDIIIFCDDDNWLCDTYVQTAHRIIGQRIQISGLQADGA